MPTPRKNIKNKGVSLYNKILKEFTKVNNKLPQDRKLSLAERRKYITERIYPQYKGNSPSRVGVKAIRLSVFQVLDTIAPKEECNPNYISPSVYDGVPWFGLDEFISEVLPKCINMKVNAGSLGETKIFNTLNYSYKRSGVSDIIDNVREEMSNGSGAEFTGVKKLMPNKPNDGTPENYYIEMVLVINETPIVELQPIIFNVPKEEKKIVTSVKNAINERVKQLNLKNKRRVKARKSAIKNVKKLKDLNKRQQRSRNTTFKDKVAQEKLKQYKAMQRQLDSALNKGNLTQEQYDKFSAELLKRTLDNRKQGGIL